ncbi:hypothetical protein EV359DRAFT_87023 [Lentinula novae-zelandiae]|nr:hypothetical protein EV359DRAFT_87023 [Lentinula novae-zelandiae]
MIHGCACGKIIAGQVNIQGLNNLLTTYREEIEHSSLCVKGIVDKRNSGSRLSRLVMSESKEPAVGAAAPPLLIKLQGTPSINSVNGGKINERDRQNNGQVTGQSMGENKINSNVIAIYLDNANSDKISIVKIRSNFSGHEFMVYTQREGVRLILLNDNYKGDWQKTRIPSVLVIYNGPNVQALGAIYLTNQYVEVLSPLLLLYFNKYETRSMENLLRFMTALQNLFCSLLKVYKKPNDYTIDSDQVSFPYPYSYRSSGTTVQFTYIKRVSQIRLVFTTPTEGDQDIIVIFGYRPHGVEAHQAAAESGFAPALLSHSNLAGEWWMVVMENLESDFQSCDDFDTLEPPCKDVSSPCLATRYSEIYRLL